MVRVRLRVIGEGEGGTVSRGQAWAMCASKGIRVAGKPLEDILDALDEILRKGCACHGIHGIAQAYVMLSYALEREWVAPAAES